ncbi:MAG: dihydroorotate dehydrogenase electron transfer subunit [Oscillospiraceae bacterium]|nr:dihydroorotate dehydrogenase electron transfer subunit [Oscillospiraceae bacterium]
MNQGIFTILENRPLTDAVFLLRLAGDTSAITAPGQFVNIALAEKFLRRPISVCDWDARSLTLICKAVGQGTAQLRAMEPGRTLDLLAGLGNGYDMEKSGETPLLVGGGVGVPPLYGLCKRLRADGKRPTVILGFNTARERFFEDEFRQLGAEMVVTTADGSCGIRGFVTDAMDRPYSYVYACGPEPMLKAVWAKCPTSGQFSFEARMGCGFGACMGCSCETKYGSKRICKDGPVLEKEEILW